MAGDARAIAERHGETAGVGGGDQLLGVGSRAVLHPGLERVGAVEGAAAQGFIVPAPDLQVAVPFGVCGSCHG